MPSLTNLPGRVAGQPMTKAIYDALEAGHDFLVVAGADLASAATIAPTHEFHGVTGTTQIDNLDHAAEVAGQQVRLWIKNGPLTIRNNGGGTGNIRTASGRDRVIAANAIVTFVYDGTVWREQKDPRPSDVLDHTEFTSTVSVTGTTQAAPTTVVTAAAVTVDGGPVVVEFFCPIAYYTAVSGNDDDYWIELYQDGSAIGVIGKLRSVTSGVSLATGRPVALRRRLTPAAGSRTFSIRAWKDESTFELQAGAGGSGVLAPGYIRVLRDS